MHNVCMSQKEEMVSVLEKEAFRIFQFGGKAC